MSLVPIGAVKIDSSGKTISVSVEGDTGAVVLVTSNGPDEVREYLRESEAASLERLVHQAVNY